VNAVDNRSILRLRFEMPLRPDTEPAEQVRSLLENVTPRCRWSSPTPPSVLDLTGAPPASGAARGLTELIWLRALALLGLHGAAGTGPTRMLAACQCAASRRGERRPGEYPGVLDVPCGARALALHTHGRGVILQVPGLIDHEHSIGVVQVLHRGRSCPAPVLTSEITIDGWSAER
jgi:hypothetical protein